TLDAELDLQHVDGRFWKVLKQFGPFGPENPKPLFWGRDLRLVGPPRTVGKDGGHLKLRVAQRGGGGVYPVIGFGLGERLPLMQQSARDGRPVELAFCVEENHWNGRTELQLKAKDVRLQES
ncbi:MAG: single-stranded-DNA-specific exonuclease RecJ, partial [Rhodothermales bacterium]|nr:single-stranded-DNA-specific exonuclease RecJ [Rhodothermales bacterium]